MKNNVILVPTDFSAVADCAIQNALILAKTSSCDIHLLHVVSNQKDIDKSKATVDKQAAELQAKENINVIGHVRVGNIFDDIGDTAAELGARFIVMGTHGVKGIQHITGSYALKVITNSKIPFIVVQEKNPAPDGFRDIVLPLDLNSKTRQKLHQAAEIAKYFDSKIHLVIPSADDEYLVNQIRRNIVFAKKYLTENKVRFSTKVADGDGSFAKQIIRYAVSNEADLISIMNIKDSIFNLFEGNSVQQVLTNDPQIPVLVVNPRDTSVSFWK
ncbi:MAG: universal stress protein [Flavobacteriales bacterium]|nr:universal stress protein [Flavobacteriales bacterium]